MSDDTLKERRRALDIVTAALTSSMEASSRSSETLVALFAVGLTLQHLIGSGVPLVDAKLDQSDEPRLTGKGGQA